MAAEVKQLVRNPELQVQATRKGAIKEMLQIQPSSSSSVSESTLTIGEEPLDVEEDKPEVEEPDKINEGIGEEPKVEGEREKEGVNTLPILPESPTKKQTARGKVVDILISWDIIEGFTVCSVMEKYQRCPNDLAGSGTVSRWWQEGIKVERIISLQENRPHRGDE
ncbi:hypothetical protein NLI96_g10634 [Meripilus lineatus]|uniref:Uncharacterized protein n=1 Tax=Meripilus lineatus TaxID=2056292 RepID=A0AAD5UTA7_9APHY|nr:hypothetical protein NLI96_g10634 [Physisporinus lineatus]